MFKILSIFTYFIKELIFDTKDEYDFSSTKFNTRKFIVFSLVVFSLCLNAFLGYRITNLATAIIVIKKNNKALLEEYSSCSTQKTNLTFKLEACENFNKMITLIGKDNEPKRK